MHRLRRFADQLLARRAGNRHWQLLPRLLETQYDDPDVIAARQLAAVRKLLAHCAESVPYYRDLFARTGFDPAVGSLAALAALPALTKADVRAHTEALRSERYRDEPVVFKRTSGSTGVPLGVYVDKPSVWWKAACTIRSDEWSGYRYGEPTAKVWGNPDYLKHGLKGRLRNWLVDRADFLDTLKFDRDVLDRYCARLVRNRPTMVFGHAHSIYLLARHVEETNVPFRPKAVISTAMPLHAWQRQVIERAFDARVTNRYGCEEVSLIACECERHRGLHLNADNLYAEIEPLSPGARTGHLLLTDLTNYAMPLVRYKVGDVVTFADRPCPCGRGLPLIESVEGREADYVVTPDGNYVSGISLTENFALHIPHVAQMQIVQESLTELRLRVVPEAGFGDESRRKIGLLVGEVFGPTVAWDVELTAAIPQEPSGKYRFCISKVAKPEPAAA